MKLKSVGAEFFHADERTDSRLDEANSRFAQFWENAS